jgi:3-oxoacyl-[acyl-carrier-protein] synthase II
MPPSDILITGAGVVSPIGVGKEAFWRSITAGESGVRPIGLFDASAMPVRIAGEVPAFDPCPFLPNRKSLKVMCRDAQFGAVASVLAFRDAKLAPGLVDPDRVGVILGADRICETMAEGERPYRQCISGGRFDYSRWGNEGLGATFPLAFLKVLPNMIASHIAIVLDARGPNNTIHHGDVSGLLAIIEGVRVIERGMADVVVAGGANSQMNPYDWVRHNVSGRLSHRNGDPATACRPFDADRDGEVHGEGAAVLVLERREHAEARGARPLGRILGWGTAFDSRCRSVSPSISGLKRAMSQAIESAGLTARDLGHVNAHGLGRPQEDQIEARAIYELLQDIPVTAPKSFFGNLCAAGAVMELVASLLGLGCNVIPPTLNYERPDPTCPVNVVAVHPQPAGKRTALALNWTWIGQAAAVVVTVD